MADQIPDCCDGPEELARKILLQFLSMSSGAPESLQPGPNDSLTDYYRKILLTFQYI